MKPKKSLIFLCMLTIFFSLGALFIGSWLVGESDLEFKMRVLCNMFFMCTPLMVIQLVIQMWRK